MHDKVSHSPVFRTCFLLLALLSCSLLLSCGKTKTATSLADFEAACTGDGLTPAWQTADDPDGEVLEYAAYGHNQELLVEFYRFADAQTAAAWYQAEREAAEAGPSASRYEMTGNNFLSETITADRAYTVITQVEDTLVIAAGPLTYKSTIDRILLSTGYLTSNL